MFDPMHNLFVMPEGIETRWASPENPTGARGQAAQANAGRKGSACFPLKAGEQRVLAEVSGRSGTVRRIWVTINDRGRSAVGGPIPSPSSTMPKSPSTTPDPGNR
jgi:hypothetical protein